MSATHTPAEVFPAGEYLRDELDERGWTVTEFAEIIGRPIQAVSEIINGKKEITTDTACSIADALGTSPDLWLNLQTNYRLHEARKATDPAPSLVARRARLRGLVPLARMRARGWLPDSDDIDALESSVRALLELDSLDAHPSFALAARRANSAEAISLEQTAWLAHVRAIARSSDVPHLNLPRLAELAGDVPRLTANGPSDLVQLPSAFAECGVALVFAEGLPGGKLDGAATFLADGRALIGLTTRGDRFDSLLFTLLHECAHLVLSHITADNDSIVDDEVGSEVADDRESAANMQASRWLFPDGFALGSTSVPSMVEAAMRYGVHPSVVIGRVQRDTGNWSQHRAKIPKVRPYLAEAGMLS